jgi:hypothetical protein
MIELLGIVFGGVSRLAQHWLDLKDKQAEREHEAVMYDKQITLADKRFDHDASMRRMDTESAESQAEWAALTAAIQAQADEAKSAGGLVAKFSAVMRPFLTFYHAVLMYTLVKVALFWIALNNGIPWASATLQMYGEFDRALVGSMVSYWFADRSLRKWGRV